MSRNKKVRSISPQTPTRGTRPQNGLKSQESRIKSQEPEFHKRLSGRHRMSNYRPTGARRPEQKRPRGTHGCHETISVRSISPQTQTPARRTIIQHGPKSLRVTQKHEQLSCDSELSAPPGAQKRPREAQMAQKAMSTYRLSGPRAQRPREANQETPTDAHEASDL
eukprot:6622699-Pyramimonas_sp.AAC.1